MTRYCLACSAKTGRLVARTCPALDRRRDAAKTKRVARTVTKREREVDARSIDGVDLLAEAKRLWRLPSVRELPRWQPELPAFTFRRAGSGWRHVTKPWRTSGHAKTWNREIVLTLGNDAADGVVTVLHELLHQAFPSDEGHSARYWSVHRSAAKEAWPDAPFDFPNAPAAGWQLARHMAAAVRQTKLS